MKRFGLALLAAAALAVWPAATRGDAATMLGFNDEPETFVTNASSARGAGARIARVAVSWELAEPVNDRYSWLEVDRAVDALDAQGIRQLFVISAAPPWASPSCARVPGDSCGVDAAFRDQYLEFASHLLDRYPGAKVQTWNEPNIALFGDMRPTLVGALTRALARRAPGRVIGPGLAPSAAHYWRYLANVYRHVPESVPIGLHVYPRSHFSGRGLNDYWRRAVRIAGDRPIWVTEIGFAESQFGAAGQARHAVTALRFLDRRGAKAVIFHRLRDQDYFWSDWLSSLGVLTLDGTPKPVYESLRRAAAKLR